MSDKVLIIEDDVDQREIFELRFRDQGFSFEFMDITEKTKEDVARYFFDNRFHMIVADHDLSKARAAFSGSEFINYMFKLCPQVKMLIMTAHETDALSGSNHPLLVLERPRNQEDWDFIIKRLQRGISSYKEEIDNSNTKIRELSDKDELSADEQIEYMRASNLLAEIQFNIDNDAVNNLKGKTIATQIYDIASSLQKIETLLEGVDV